MKTGAPKWTIVVATASIFVALVLSLVLQRWLASIAWLAAFAMSLAWLSERAGDDRG